MLVRLYLEKRARDKEEEAIEAAEREKALEEAEKRNSMLEHVPAETLQAPTPENKEDEKKKKTSTHASVLGHFLLSCCI